MEPLSAVCAEDETAVKVKVTLVMISYEQAESIAVELFASHHCWLHNLINNERWSKKCGCL